MISVTDVFNSLATTLGVLVTYIITHVHHKVNLNHLNRNLYMRLMSGEDSIGDISDSIKNRITQSYSKVIREKTGPLNPVRTPESRYVVYGGYLTNGHPRVEFYVDTLEEAKAIRDIFKEHIVDEFRIKFLA